MTPILLTPDMIDCQRYHCKMKKVICLVYQARDDVGACSECGQGELVWEWAKSQLKCKFCKILPIYKQGFCMFCWKKRDEYSPEPLVLRVQKHTLIIRKEVRDVDSNEII